MLNRTNFFSHPIGIFLSIDNPIRLFETSTLANRINHIITYLPELLQKRTLRKEVDILNDTYSDELLIIEKGQPSQKSMALLFLTAIVQAYIWENADCPAAVIPNVLTKNLFPLCKAKQRFPIITYADYVLHNWSKIDKDSPITLDNIEPIVTFTGTPDEIWFIKIHVMIESIGEKALQSANEMRKLIKQENIENDDKSKKIINELQHIQQSLAQAINMMHRMHERCDPTVYWDKLRPYLNGWEKVRTNETTVGILFTGLVSKDKLPIICAGPSGAQSSIIPALDAALSIKHHIDGMHKKLLEFQTYMPRNHQAYIFKLENTHVRQYMKKNDLPALEYAYNAAVKEVQMFRGAHLALVHQYIYQPAQQRGIDLNQMTGTGGTSMNAYLSGRYTDTVDSRRSSKPRF